MAITIKITKSTGATTTVKVGTKGELIKEDK